MAWVADRAALRTCDAERGLELRPDGGGSGGRRNFIIHSIGKPDEPLAGFYAYLETRPATEDERAKYPGVVEIATWRISGSWGPGLDVPGCGPTESIEIFREAMREFKWSHGSVNNLTRYEA